VTDEVIPVLVGHGREHDPLAHELPDDLPGEDRLGIEKPSPLVQPCIVSRFAQTRSPFRWCPAHA
jgi:hypothetical protein